MKKSVHIIAPASCDEITSLQKRHIQKFLANYAFQIFWGKHTFSKSAQFGAKDCERLTDLIQAFKTNPNVILAMRGGYGSARLLPMIDWKVLKKSSSLFVGSSDLTTFQNAYYKMTHRPTITGMLATYLKTQPQDTLVKSFFNILDGGNIEFTGLPSYAKGKASGTLIGGNLTCFSDLIGTPYLPEPKGKILLLEEVCEAPYRLDRMLTHLKNAGIFDKVSGVILGDFYKCRNNDDKTDDNAYKVLENFFKDFKIPVVYGLAYGHTPQHFCLPLGTKTIIDTQKGTVHIDGIKKKC